MIGATGAGGSMGAGVCGCVGGGAMGGMGGGDGAGTVAPQVDCCDCLHWLERQHAELLDARG